MISRIAPTPSGHLHWGNLLNIAITWSMVRKHQGTLWLRIDDVDATRVRNEYVDRIFEVLIWLELNWDQGPHSTQEFFKSFSQSLRKEEYFSKLKGLKTYSCTCSRQMIQDRTQGNQYDGHCRNLNLTFEPGRSVIRAALESNRDPILWTKEDQPAYHWVSILDDLRFGTTDIVRGEDLREASEIQSEVASAMGAADYLKINHHFHPLILDSTGTKLSKTKASDSIWEFKEQGGTAEDAWLEFSRRAKIEPVKSAREFLEKKL